MLKISHFYPVIDFWLRLLMRFYRNLFLSTVSISNSVMQLSGKWLRGRKKAMPVNRLYMHYKNLIILLQQSFSGLPHWASERILQQINQHTCSVESKGSGRRGRSVLFWLPLGDHLPPSAIND
ncbi:hypothetical protein FYF90_03985 [Enterobacter sp. RVSM5a]|nr:hypothetical protein FYF90_03985 [Enterobacter sp. RVSM5a]